MSDCNETIRELNRFLDNELDDDFRAHIHNHLGGCIDCHEAYGFEAELKAAIKRKCSNDEMPPGLLDKIRQCFSADFVADIDTACNDTPHTDPA